MIRMIGSIMIAGACAAAGWHGKQDLRKRVVAFNDAVGITEHLRMGLCCRRMTLPDTLAELEKAYPRRFPNAVRTLEKMRDIPFVEYWRACLLAGDFPFEAADILTDAVTAISQGQQPERTLDICSSRLESLKKEAEAREREKSRLYMALGLGGGCTLAIDFL